jgi:mono/diheme cytochrome c family protein
VAVTKTRHAKAPFGLPCLLGLSLWACDRPPSAGSLEEWTPADHHSSDDDKLAQGSVQAAAGKGAGDRSGQNLSGASDVARLVDITWRQQCSSCHGPTGKGDGQMGPMVRAPDLTREEWQSKVTDGEMANTIKNGKGKMPKFDVPDAVVAGLVARVRGTRGR